MNMKPVVACGVSALIFNTSAMCEDTPGAGGIVQEFHLVYSTNNEPSYFTAGQGKAAAQMAIDVYKELLLDEHYNFCLEIKWVNGTGLAEAVTYPQEERTWSTIRNTLSTRYLTDLLDEDMYETDLVLNYPSAAGIKYINKIGSQVTTPNVLLAKFQCETICNISLPDAVIEINANLRPPIDPNDPLNYWDPDPSDGIDSLAYDLVAAIVHEIGHHMGFISAVEQIDQNDTNSITLWDIFRFPESMRPVSLPQFLSSPREVRLHEDALGVTGITSPRQIKLSTGKSAAGVGDQASHWLRPGMFDTGRRGIMVPSAVIGLNFLQQNGWYFTESDIRAFDLMGYTIDRDTFSPINFNPNLSSPQFGSPIGTTDPITLNWTLSTTPIFSNIRIFDLGEEGALNQPSLSGPLVYSKIYHQGNSITINPSEMSIIPGRTYQAQVSIFTGFGFSYTNDLVFQTPSPPAYIGRWSSLNETAYLTPHTGLEELSFSGTDVAISNDVIVVGEEILANSPAGRVRVYELHNTQWQHKQTLVHPNPENSVYPFFGTAVDIEGDILGVGDRPHGWDDSEGALDVGAVYLYEFASNNWIHKEILTPSDGLIGDHFGNHLSINNGRIAVGALRSVTTQGRTGAVYIYENISGNWTETSKISPPAGHGDYHFGTEVSLNGNNLLIGSPHDDTMGVQSGSAYLYNYDGTSWSLIKTFRPSDLVTNDRFGVGLRINGDLIAIGADGGTTTSGAAVTSPGKVYMYRFDGTLWQQEDVLTPTGGSPGDNYGFTVGLSDSGKAVVGNSQNVDGNPSGSGTIHVYEQLAGLWQEIHTFTAQDGIDGDGLGWSVEISENTITAGAPLRNGEHILDGAAFVFNLTPCYADLTSDGITDYFDISEFMILYGANDPIADWDNSGSWNFFDVSFFLAEYHAGCQ